jgi:hypothetical protein
VLAYSASIIRVFASDVKLCLFFDTEKINDVASIFGIEVEQVNNRPYYPDTDIKDQL